MINLYSVQLHLEQEGWGLLSDNYENLKTPLKLVCPKGHIQEQSYGEWRNYKTCEVCLAGKKNIQKDVKENTNNNFRILALDAATITTGYAVYDNNVLVDYGIFNANKRLDVHERIDTLRQWLEGRIEQWKPDFIGIEDIQLENGNVKSFKALANLQGVVVNTILNHNIDYKLILSEGWRRTCKVNGKNREAKKRAAQERVKSWYNIECTEDEADAICIGKHFTQKIYRESKDGIVEGYWG